LANSFESKGAPLFSYSCVWDFQANQNIITHSLIHSLRTKTFLLHKSKLLFGRQCWINTLFYKGGSCVFCVCSCLSRRHSREDYSFFVCESCSVFTPLSYRREVSNFIIKRPGHWQDTSVPILSSNTSKLHDNCSSRLQSFSSEATRRANSRSLPSSRSNYNITSL